MFDDCFQIFMTRLQLLKLELLIYPTDSLTRTLRAALETHTRTYGSTFGYFKMSMAFPLRITSQLHHYLCLHHIC